MAFHRALVLATLISLISPVAFPAKVIKKGSGPYYKIPFRPKWVTKIKKGKLFKYQRKEFASPRIYQGKIFVGADSNYFYALKQKSGRKLWRFQTEGGVHSTPAFHEEKVFFGDNKGILYALDITSGKQLWRFDKTDSEILAAPVIHGDYLYLTTLEGKLIALNLQNGDKIWEVLRKPLFKKGFTIRGQGGPLVADGKIFVGFSDGILAAYRQSDGHLLWEKNLAVGEGPFFDIDMVPLLDGSKLYVARFQGEVVCLDLSGKIFWKQKIGSGVNFTVEGETLYVSGSDGILYALNKEAGTKIWEKKITSGALSSPIIVKSTVIVGSTEKKVYFFNAANGDIKTGRFAKKGVFGDPISDGENIYYLSNGGSLYALKVLY